MKLKELQILAQKIQLEIKDEELPTYLEMFENLEKLLINFKKIKNGQENKIIDRINTGFLTLSDLKKLTKKYSQQKVTQKTLQVNSKVDENGFVLFKKD